METTKHSTGLENQTLEQLRTKMGAHSNNIISDILEFTQTTNPEIKDQIKDQIEETIKDNIVNFLEQKAAIKSEYESGDENGEAYHFDNRENYRQKMTKLIESILQDTTKEDATEKVQETRIKLKKVLENDGR